jgi:putative Mn2+ efflux pump MntP
VDFNKKNNMEKIKKIWLWVSGAIVSFIGLFFIFSKISDSNKEKKEFKKKKKGLEED